MQNLIKYCDIQYKLLKYELTIRLRLGVKEIEWSHKEMVSNGMYLSKGKKWNRIKWPWLDVW